MSSSLRYLLPWHWLPFRLFSRRKSETDYETILESLAKDVVKVQSRLTQIRQRERRAMITIPFYILVIWAFHTWLCWYMAWLGPLSEVPAALLSGEELHWKKTGSWLPVLSTPVGLLFGRRIVRWWYKRIATAEEKHLRRLRKTQRSKIEEIKKATRYDHLRMLLSKYDDTQGATNTPRRPSPGVPSGGSTARVEGQQQQQLTHIQQQQQVQKGLGTQSSMDNPQRRSMSNPSQLGIHLRHSETEKSPTEVGENGAAFASKQHPNFPHKASNGSPVVQQVDTVLAAAKNGNASGSEDVRPRLSSDSVQQQQQRANQQATAFSASSAHDVHIPSSIQQQQSYRKPLPLAQIQPQVQAPSRTFLDKVADLMLGPDPTTRGPGPEQRYALICPDCKRHNGLCMKEDWEEIQYICPNCGRFNSNRPSTVPTSWPSGGGGRARVDSNASIRSFLFSAFGVGGAGGGAAAGQLTQPPHSADATLSRSMQRISSSHLVTNTSALRSGTGAAPGESNSHVSLPSTPAKKAPSLGLADTGNNVYQFKPEGKETLSSSNDSAVLSPMMSDEYNHRLGGDAITSMLMAKGGGKKRAVDKTSEVEIQEVLMTPDQNVEAELKLKLGNLRRRVRAPSDSARGQDEEDTPPPSASLMDGDADISMEIHRRR
ncbi:hypothetical protein K437DRAFT_260152 [Tilletiaria anomala UBC 951]|uniref:Endoplasmic reticulum junction formation protein lunapark n=1 Tax=Tilletiaria anomala (strain ATCC 24038 / CBS 436.72 / UBC 951) TaxID=1037660 RepID=A0A066V7U5_TILAU|nr:uncharacterized protein K437DRAFT_260152 [Tilletiaria anomala UBC 951]KDN36328.1 hypothetical protein K437DRAFT_260152 [Tilletiaria anomala UBC 951]